MKELDGSNHEMLSCGALVMGYICVSHNPSLVCLTLPTAAFILEENNTTADFSTVHFLCH